MKATLKVYLEMDMDLQEAKAFASALKAINSDLEASEDAGGIVTIEVQDNYDAVVVDDQILAAAKEAGISVAEIEEEKTEQEAEESCYFQIIGHEREQGDRIANTIAQQLGSYFTGEISYGYEPDSIKVHFNGDMPSKEAQRLLDKVESDLKSDYPHKDFQVSIEIP